MPGLLAIVNSQPQLKKMLRIVEEKNDKVNWSLFTQYSEGYGLELSDLGMDWAIEIQDDIPIGIDPDKYYLSKIDGMSEEVKALMLEFWQVSDDLLLMSANGSKSTT